MHSIPMFGFALLCFLLLAVVLAVAVFFAFKSGEKGQTKLGGCAGCAIAAALLLIGGLGALGVTIVGVFSFTSEAVKHGPVKSFGFEWDDSRHDTMPPGMSEPGMPAPPDWPTPPPQVGQRSGPDEHGQLRLTLEVRGKDGAAKVLEWVRRKTKAPVSIAVRESHGDAQGPITTIELSIPIDEDDRADLEETRRDLERDLPDLKLPKGVKVEFRGPND
jgi:hypothetical protein